MRAIAILATVLALAGCIPQKPAAQTKLSTETLPWTLEQAEKNLGGMTKENVIALLGKPDDLSDGYYYYRARKYLTPDIGAKDDKPTGMELFFSGNYVRGVRRL